MNWLALLLSCVMMTEARAGEQSPQAVVDLSQLMDLSALVDSVADRRVVFVGESHDQYAHHLNQLAIIKGMHDKHSDMAIGLEFFAQPYQSVLDAYVSGEIDEAQMLRDTQYFERWRFDYRLYRPILRYAREHGIPLIALNLESEITEKVGRGGLDALDEDQRARVPAEIDRNNETYHDRLKAIFDSHPHGEGRSFENFLDVQLLWDEGMAERAARWLNEHPGSPMVVLAGIGHLMYGDGIPKRLYRRVPDSQAIVLNVNSPQELDPALGDFVILANGPGLPPAGKLGILLNTQDNPLSINGFVEGSGAAAAGLKEKDRILALDDRSIEHYSDLRVVLMDKGVGDKVLVKFERDRMFIGATIETVEVTLK
ncbi:MAG: ChaN family lipoprotein [Candidatus Thiodiazotropha sp.]